MRKSVLLGLLAPLLVHCGADSRDVSASGGSGAAGGDSAVGGSGGASGTTGGAPATGGGTASGGAEPGGAATGGSATGGSATGGNTTGGSTTGGNTTGGSATGGSATGGSATGGSATGGSATGGSTTGGSATGGGAATPYGVEHSGDMWLGPVEFEGSLTNGCDPAGRHYSATVQEAYGPYLIGIDNRSFDQDCDRCARVTANGHTAIAHVITFGVDTSADAIDVSPELYAFLELDGNHQGTWQLVTCPTTEPVYYELDGRDWSNVYYFRVWVRNARLPFDSVEVRLTASDAWRACEAQGDGAYQCTGADYSAGFQLRVTSLDGQTLVDTLPGVGTFDATQPIASHGNFL